MDDYYVKKELLVKDSDVFEKDMQDMKLKDKSDVYIRTEIEEVMIKEELNIDTDLLNETCNGDYYLKREINEEFVIKEDPILFEKDMHDMNYGDAHVENKIEEIIIKEDSNVMQDMKCGSWNSQKRQYVGKRPPKTPAERARDCRARKKLLREQNALETKRKAKSSTERTREYRIRQKLAKGEIPDPLKVTASVETTTFMNNDPGPSTTNILFNSPSHHSPEQNTGNELGIIVKKIPKTALERAREYRARKKFKVNEVASQNLVYITSISNSQDQNISDNAMVKPGKRQPKTAAERARDYRARKRLKPKIIAEPPVLRLTDAEIAEQHLYSEYKRNIGAHDEFNKRFYQNPFGYACTVCQRLWFKDDLKPPNQNYQELVNVILPDVDLNDILLCHTCRLALAKGAIPRISVYNGFQYPEMPDHLPPLDLLSERLVSPRLPFMQIRRLRHEQGQNRIYGQVINVPACVNNMVHRLPREINDFCINVHIKQKKSHKLSSLIGLVDKENVETWVEYLINTPLYRLYKISVNKKYFTENNIDQFDLEEVSEDISEEESFSAQQHTFLWNEDKYLQLTTGDGQNAISLLFDDHAEELSFPCIYLGQSRNFREGVRVTPFMTITSEIRRSDRRGVLPQHLFYMVMKILRIRVRDFLILASKKLGRNLQFTKQQMESREFIDSCLETNLAFLRTIPNSSWYWAERKRDVFAMIRQLGRPTMFLTFSANELGWNDLLCTLYRLKNGTDISEEDIALLNLIEKNRLINEDAVTCAIYFSKMINILMSILRSKKNSPFRQYYVLEYFKRIEFQYSGSPQAHILLWLNNAPKDPLGTNLKDAIRMIDQLINVSSSEASGHIILQTSNSNNKEIFRFEVPFMPHRITTILKPMPKEHPDFENYHKRYKDIRSNLEANDYSDLYSFYRENEITSDEEYLKILQAGINTPQVFLKRQPNEKWHVPFNPFILSVLKSNMNFQFIADEYSCSAYVDEYINKTDGGISDLQQQILKIKDENPSFDIIEIAKKMSVDVLNTIEMTSQEAAWFLLREPMSQSSIRVTFIPTMWPAERQLKKNKNESNEMDDDDLKENIFEKYEKRPEYLEGVTLAQFVAKYSAKFNGQFEKRQRQRIIRYKNYDMADNLREYKREMVTLHIPFRSEEHDILTDMKFILIYDEYEQLILDRRKEFEPNLDINKTFISRLNENNCAAKNKVIIKKEFIEECGNKVDDFEECFIKEESDIFEDDMQETNSEDTIVNFCVKREIDEELIKDNLNS